MILMYWFAVQETFLLYVKTVVLLNIFVATDCFKVNIHQRIMKKKNAHGLQKNVKQQNCFYIDNNKNH